MKLQWGARSPLSSIDSPTKIHSSIGQSVPVHRQLRHLRFMNSFGLQRPNMLCTEADTTIADIMSTTLLHSSYLPRSGLHAYQPCCDNSVHVSELNPGAGYEADMNVPELFSAARKIPSFDHESPPATLEPRHLFQHEEPLLNVESSLLPNFHTTYGGDIGLSGESAHTASPDESALFQDFYQSQGSREDCSPSSSERTFRNSSSRPAEDESGTDKPYARLIWEALMQAPYHKMVLRDLYDWFEKNTTKAQDSGTDGWRNSIRHNLSMNQAFENDKSVHCCPKGQSRKANSVWTLTEAAIRHGVQSTTRYRKTGNTKKVVNSLKLATQRQKSGARGGRAAHRSAARSKKHKAARPTFEPLPKLDMTLDLQQNHLDFADDSPFGATQYYENQPATPGNYGVYAPLYALPATTSGYEPVQELKHEQINLLDYGTGPFDYLAPYDVSPSFTPVFPITTE